VSRARERRRWGAILARCENPAVARYADYGGRGITVCERWHNFDAFYADIARLLGPCPPGKTLDRMDNDGGYEPGNVQWATTAEQMVNRRTPRPAQRTGRYAAPPSPWATVPKAAPRLGMHPDTIRRMIRDREIAAVKGPHINSPYKISEAEITRWLADHANRPASDVAS
jgi:excisionase family DNA binding protein